MNTTIKYSYTSYPQREYKNETILTNASTNQILYLLSSADGIYTTLSVTSSGGTAVTGADVIVERSFAGVMTQVGHSATDDSGLVTFWVNPYYSHRFTLVKSGCTTYYYTITPTQSLYEITMSCGGADVVSTAEVYTPQITGLKWLKTPASGIIDSGQTNFTYTIYSSWSDITGAKFEVVNFTGGILNSTSSACTSSGCILSMYYNVNDGDQLKGRYYVQTTNTSGYILLEGDAYWKCIDTNISDTGTLRDFMINLRYLFSEWGSEYDCAYTSEATCNADTNCKWVDVSTSGGDNRCIPSDARSKEEYSRFVLIFFFLAFLYAAINKATNFDSSSPGIIILFLTIIVWIGSIAGGRYYGLFYYDGLFGYSDIGMLAGNYLLAILLTAMTASHFLARHRRET